MDHTQFAAEGIAAGAIIASLLDTLVRKQTLTQAEARRVAVDAYRGVQIYMKTSEGIAASNIIGMVVGRFS